MLLSGSTTVTIFGCLILFTAFWIHGFLYRMVGDPLWHWRVMSRQVRNPSGAPELGRARFRPMRLKFRPPVCRWIVDRNECCDRQPGSQYDSDFDDSEYGGDDGQSSHTRTSPSMDEKLGLRQTTAGRR